jgi:hypothetical protein
MVLQRGQRATMRGPKAGTFWNNPQPGHARKPGGVFFAICVAENSENAGTFA